MSVLQQHVLPLDVCPFFDRLCCLWTRLFHNSLCHLGTCVSSMAASAALERVSSLCFPWTCPCVRATAVCNVLRSVWPAAACLCFKCPYLFNSSQCCAKRSMAYSSLCSICTVCLQEPVLHLDVSIYTSFCATPACLSTRALCFTQTCLATRVLCCTWMCLPTRALCCTWTCLSARLFAAPVRVCLQELCDAPGRVYLQECSPGCTCNCRCSVENLFGLFRFVSKQFCLFRLFRYRFETPKQTEIVCFWFHETNRNKRETDLVSVCFGSNRNLFLFVSRTP